MSDASSPTTTADTPWASSVSVDTNLGVYQPESAGGGGPVSAATSTGAERRWRRDDPSLCCWTSSSIRRMEKSRRGLRGAGGAGATVDEDGTAVGKVDDGAIICVGSTAAAAERRDDDADVIEWPSPFSRLPISTIYCLHTDTNSNQSINQSFNQSETFNAAKNSNSHFKVTITWLVISDDDVRN